MHDPDRIFDTVGAASAFTSVRTPSRALRDVPLRHSEARADELGLDDAAELLQASLDEEEARDEALLKSRNRR
jgi:hypothetical protein